jgi:sugar phosphate isomerase/epimerase
VITRRDLLIQSALLAGSLPAARLASAALESKQKLRAISLHLFQVKPADAAQTCHAAQAMGYAEIEATYQELQSCGTQIAASPISKLSVEAQGSDVLLGPGKEGELSRLLDDCRKWGFSYVGMSYNGTDSDSEMSRLDYLDRFQLYAERFNRAADKARAAGLTKLLYHNMPFGFTPGEDTWGHQTEHTFGHKIVWDLIDQPNCGIQLDVYWVKLAGLNPADILKSLSGRVKIVHLKDLPAGMPVAYEHPKPTDILDIGAGVMNWPEVLGAARSAGVEHFTVEPPDVQNAAELMVHAQKSYDYLSRLRF